MRLDKARVMHRLVAPAAVLAAVVGTAFLAPAALASQTETLPNVNISQSCASFSGVVSWGRAGGWFPHYPYIQITDGTLRSRCSERTTLSITYTNGIPTPDNTLSGPVATITGSRAAPVTWKAQYNNIFGSNYGNISFQLCTAYGSGECLSRPFQVTSEPKTVSVPSPPASPVVVAPPTLATVPHAS
jgi:hypothetical protein